MFNHSRVETLINLSYPPVLKQDANGQFELNWAYDDCLKTADRHTFFKFMTKTVAEKHGERYIDKSLIVARMSRSVRQCYRLDTALAF